MDGTVKSASRVLDVIEMLSVAPAPLGVSEVARRLAIPKSSAQALLATLVARAYAERHGTRYALAIHVAGGWANGLRGRLLHLARPIMRRAADRSGESAFLGMLLPSYQVEFAAKEISRNEVRYDAGLDHPRAIHATSMGLVFLAHLDARSCKAILARPLERVTPKTLVDREELRSLLHVIRARGFAEVRDGNVMGASGVSAPIFAPDGSVLAALNLGAPSFRYNKARSKMVSEVLAAAGELTQQLGGRGAAFAGT